MQNAKLKRTISHLHLGEPNCELAKTEFVIKIKNGYCALIGRNSYENAKSFAPDSRRTRKLLLHKQEIQKLEKKTKEKGYALIPTKIYFKNGRVKVEIGVAKGKKLYDKRQTLKEKVIKKDIQRATKALR